jgi:hypothetical protein
LGDDPALGDAIDCMVQFFYDGVYDDTESTDSLLHAQVAIIADKYECASLSAYSMAALKTAIMNTDFEKWITTASFIYNNTSSEIEYHRLLRDLVVDAVTDRYEEILPKLQIDDSRNQLFRNAPDLAADLFLRGAVSRQEEEPSYEHKVFQCDSCLFIHIGPFTCSSFPWTPVSPNSGLAQPSESCCPSCFGPAAYHCAVDNDLTSFFSMRPCGNCDGSRTEYTTSRGQFFGIQR